MSTEPSIKIEGIDKFYGTKQVLTNLNLEVERGLIYGFLGPNGSGKSTTIKILCGLVKPNAGNAHILGSSVLTDMDNIRQHIGYMSQKFSLYDDLTVKQNLKFYSGLYGLSGDRFRQRLKTVMELTNIEPYLHTKAGFLSGGWKQRLALGCAIIHEPPVIFLDEPTAGIDPVARRDLWDLLFDLSSQGVTLFVTTHYMDEAERCHKVAYIYEGQLIADGTSDELRELDVITPAGTRRIEVICDPVMQAYRILTHHDNVLDVTVFGVHLHLLVQETFTDAQIKTYLKQQSIHVQAIQPMSPSLEDVFVTLTQRAIENQEVTAP